MSIFDFLKPKPPQLADMPLQELIALSQQLGVEQDEIKARRRELRAEIDTRLAKPQEA